MPPPLPGTASRGNAFDGGRESNKCRKPEPKPKTKEVGFVMTYNFKFRAPALTTEQMTVSNFGGDVVLNFNKRGGHNLEN